MYKGIKTFKIKLSTGNGAAAVIPTGSKWGADAGTENSQIPWAWLFATAAYYLKGTCYLYVMYLLFLKSILKGNKYYNS